MHCTANIEPSSYSNAPSRSATGNSVRHTVPEFSPLFPLCQAREHALKIYEGIFPAMPPGPQSRCRDTPRYTDSCQSQYRQCMVFQISEKTFCVLILVVVSGVTTSSYRCRQAPLSCLAKVGEMCCGERDGALIVVERSRNKHASSPLGLVL